jgi:hypothetical protein
VEAKQDEEEGGATEDELGRNGGQVADGADGGQMKPLARGLYNKLFANRKRLQPNHPLHVGGCPGESMRHGVGS